jgi:hypothetical protein
VAWLKPVFFTAADCMDITVQAAEGTGDTGGTNAGTDGTGGTTTGAATGKSNTPM